MVKEKHIFMLQNRISYSESEIYYYAAYLFKFNANIGFLSVKVKYMEFIKFLGLMRKFRTFMDCDGFFVRDINKAFSTNHRSSSESKPFESSSFSKNHGHIHTYIHTYTSKHTPSLLLYIYTSGIARILVRKLCCSYYHVYST